MGFLRQAEAGIPVKYIRRQGGFSDATFYRWRTCFGGMAASETQRLHTPGTNNNRLNKLWLQAHQDIKA
ncbi:transposase [Azohydromonas caseinilytica]|uniref:Transposase n=1 Tax=Azohydromonas caseinilytica TaxID=2728836 RepID=A0A848FJT3_9BURK|nr:transposase [Azohydromonas caseinilytica]